jgi:hypothetical protein
MKKPVRTLRVNRETLSRLDLPTLEKIGGGATLRCTTLCTLGSCGHICP